ncbi:phosphopantetheine-binding protein [Pseudomonas syringae group genomosp. 3]|uniref:phosphopantetheine-binding protein n=1 Tax=Pseudomonas syringae group genomosp. 3 TaxID=251701 RepID=UPI0016053EE8|nr:phosphopantetheine-binding protein [Pseudomonas syringae group genomosp. 3]
MSDRTEQLKALLARELDINMADVTPESRLKELGTDLDFDGAIMNIQTEFDLIIPDKVIDGFVTVQDLINYVSKHAK